ncbi:hypothetical protein VTJ04DRAFT_6567 [Mycothermus thermophilus]|uniref:uncharacterized protein n=1 Tax=Humicola insolens TaxID=85995 RepID=UPI0037433D7A
MVRQIRSSSLSIDALCCAVRACVCCLRLASCWFVVTRKKEHFCYILFRSVTWAFLAFALRCRDEKKKIKKSRFQNMK